MSNFIYGRIVCKDIAKLIDSKLDFEMIDFCLSNNFGMHFIDTLPTKSTFEDINFQLSDNFLVSYCDLFMEPIIYTLDGKPLINSLNNDLNKLHALISKVFEYDFVKKIELRFSYIEVNEEEYEICETTMHEFKNLILEKYLATTGFPTINVIINRVL